jgi:hypothetical protein
MREAWKRPREFTRCQTALEVEIVVAGRKIVGSTRDVSMNGLYLSGERSVVAGLRCTVRLFVGGRETGARVDAVGRIARVDPGGIAVNFDEVSFEGYQHLKQLILLNAEDPDLAAEEIDRHVGLRRRDP